MIKILLATKLISEAHTSKRRNRQNLSFLSLKNEAKTLRCRPDVSSVATIILIFPLNHCSTNHLFSISLHFISFHLLIKILFSFAYKLIFLLMQFIKLPEINFSVSELTSCTINDLLNPDCWESLCGPGFWRFAYDACNYQLYTEWMLTQIACGYRNLVHKHTFEKWMECKNFVSMVVEIQDQSVMLLAPVSDADACQFCHF